MDFQNLKEEVIVQNHFNVSLAYYPCGCNKPVNNPLSPLVLEQINFVFKIA